MVAAGRGATSLTTMPSMNHWNWDRLEDETLLSEHRVPQAADVDVRKVAKFAGSLSPLLFLAVGPLSVGALAAMCSTSSLWNSANQIAPSTSGSSNPVEVPISLLSINRTTFNSGRPGGGVRGDGMPLLPGTPGSPAVSKPKSSASPMTPDASTPNPDQQPPSGNRVPKAPQLFLQGQGPASPARPVPKTATPPAAE